MKHLICVICTLLCVSCYNQSNRQTAFDVGCGEGCFCPVYVLIENEKTAEIQWIGVDVLGLLTTLDSQKCKRDSILDQLKKNVHPSVPYVVSDSAYKELVKYGNIEFDEEIYNYYKQYGVDSLMQHYDLNKYGNIFLEGNTDGKKIDYIGFLLWQNDILIGMGDEVNEWYYVR
ncbi:MAG: hypothetical protein MJ010_07015 [Paludibacteraceae bacterium]|nr:hypothetical protein [Paludibacteraceae bacterium]